MNRQEVVKAFAIAAVRVAHSVARGFYYSVLPDHRRKSAIAQPVASTAPVPKATCWSHGSKPKPDSKVRPQPDERSSAGRNAGTTATWNSSASSRARGRFRRMDQRSWITAPTMRRRTGLGRSTPVFVVLDVSDPAIHSRPRTWTTLPQDATRTKR